MQPPGRHRAVPHACSAAHATCAHSRTCRGGCALAIHANDLRYLTRVVLGTSSGSDVHTGDGWEKSQRTPRCARRPRSGSRAAKACARTTHAGVWGACVCPCTAPGRTYATGPPKHARTRTAGHADDACSMLYAKALTFAWLGAFGSLWFRPMVLGKAKRDGRRSAGGWTQHRQLHTPQCVLVEGGARIQTPVRCCPQRHSPRVLWHCHASSSSAERQATYTRLLAYG